MFPLAHQPAPAWQHRPAYVDLVLTDDCNCRCDYCFAGTPGRRSHLDYLAAKRVIDLLLDSWEGGDEPGILLFGGEPLLEFELIRYLVEYAGRRHAAGAPRMSWSMTTNGTLMTEPMMGFFAEHGIKYLLSIDGSREVHNIHRKLKGGKGSFDQLAKRLRLMKSYQPWMGARMTPTPETVKYLSQSADELCDLGINQFIIGMASEVPWTDQDGDAFIEQMMQLHEVYLRRTAAGQYMRFTLFEKAGLDDEERDLTDVWGCGAGRGRYCVNPRGELFGCARFAAIGSGRGGMCLGDVWRGPYRESHRCDMCNTSAWHRPACVECEYRNQCTGGCPAVNFADTGSIFDPSPNECLSTRVYAELKQRLASHPSRSKETTQ